jgi:tungstate transport system substrate-binding protein
MKLAVVGVAALLCLSACGGPVRVVVAAGTTLVDSGIIDELVSRYEAEHADVELSVVGESTAQILELGRRGGADLLITHAPDLEAEFVGEGLAASYEPVMKSRFVLVGPPEAAALPAGVAAAFRDLAGRAELFVSRSDGSGTYQKEQELWDLAGVDPTGRPWYIQTGQGMGLTLQVADQRRAFVLSELGAYLAAAPVLSLETVALADDPVLFNPYQVIVVDGTPVEPLAAEFAAWLVSGAGAEAIVNANLELFGDVVYEPVGP